MNLIETLQKKMQEENISAYIIPTSDYHQSEYISDYFKIRAYISGFTGSAGTLVITLNEACLWTDGRYFLQAAREIKDTGIKLMKMGLPDTPTIFKYLNHKLNNNDTLGFDGKMLGSDFILELEKHLGNKKLNYVYDKDFINSIWPNRPGLPNEQVYELALFFAGESYQKKLEQIRMEMHKQNATAFVLTALEDQAWLYNLRGNDILYTPVFLAYSLITLDKVILYIDKEKLSKEVIKYLKENDIKIADYFAIYDDVLILKKERVIVDTSKVNYELYNKLASKNEIIKISNPTLGLKAIKNETEIKNTKLAHLKDGVAVTKFIYYVKHNYKKDKLTELKASDYLLECRKNEKGFIEQSFNTICAFNENAAMLHYSATLETDTQIDGNGLLLVDSGGQYLEGTTDITRTIAIGQVSEEMKLHYTTVLKSVIALSKATFMAGCRGVNLDILARGPIWDLFLDYRCGTGHGVGHLLSVHEGPNGFRWKIVPERNDSAVLLPGMITTNEPGIYLENEYGIRIENEMLCYKKGSSEYGDFLGFETITYAPIDLDAIDERLLSKEEKNWLNDYHEMVFNKLRNYLNNEELEWLTFATRKI